MTSLKTSIKTITYLSDIGCLEIQGASLVHASKSETDHNLGLHIQLVFENGEIRYSTHHENRLLLILFNDTNTETIGFDALKRLPDPPRELPFWSDSFIHLHDDWCALIKYGHSSPKLADLSSGLHIQEIIEAF